jgi:hypothetical protein
VVSGRCADAAGVYLAGLDVAGRLGAFGSYGPRLLPYAATAWDGDLAAAQTDFRQVLGESPALDPARAAEVLSYVAEVALWDGRLPDGRTAVADGLAVLTAAEEQRARRRTW